jgi:hypothetical protein
MYKEGIFHHISHKWLIYYSLRLVVTAHMGEMRNACNILVRKPEGKRPLG